MVITEIFVKTPVKSLACWIHFSSTKSQKKKKLALATATWHHL